jgi:serine/threonine protein kinase
MIGSILNERYWIDEEIGQGGMGTVYRGFDTTLDRQVAIKVLTISGLGTEGRAQLLDEAQMAAWNTWKASHYTKNGLGLFRRH